MPSGVIAGLTTLANWLAVEADGVTPSAELVISEDAAIPTPSGDSRSIVIAGIEGAFGHIARCTLAPAQDWTNFDELRLGLRSDIAASGAAYVELRLGSAALPIGAPGNDWHRRLPLAACAWETVRVALDDLPGAVRGAANRAELRCLDDQRDFMLQIDEALAVRPRMLADVEQALVDLLHNRFVLEGSPVPAQLSIAGGSLPVARPCIAIVPLDLRAATERAAGSSQRCDVTTDGYRMRPAATAYEMGFAVEALADTRVGQAAITDFLLDALPTQGTLRVTAQALACEAMPAPSQLQDLNLVPTPRQRLHYRVWAWRSDTAATPVRPVQDVVTNVDWKEQANA